jgi:hypothetical protein
MSIIRPTVVVPAAILPSDIQLPPTQPIDITDLSSTTWEQPGGR